MSFSPHLPVQNQHSRAPEDRSSYVAKHYVRPRQGGHRNQHNAHHFFILHSYSPFTPRTISRKLGASLSVGRGLQCGCGCLVKHSCIPFLRRHKRLLPLSAYKQSLQILILPRRPPRSVARRAISTFPRHTTRLQHCTETCLPCTNSAYTQNILLHWCRPCASPPPPRHALP